MKKRNFLITFTSACVLTLAYGNSALAATAQTGATPPAVSVEQSAALPGTAGRVRLEIVPARNTESGRTVATLKFTVSPASAIKGFDFAYFEGPGAPVARQKLMQIAVTRAGKTTTRQAALSGYYSADVADGFVFESSDAAGGKANAISAILQSAAGAERIEIAVPNGKDRSLVLRAAFPLKPQ